MNFTSKLSIMRYFTTCSRFQLSYDCFFGELHHFEDIFFSQLRYLFCTWIPQIIYKLDLGLFKLVCFFKMIMRSHFFISISFSGTIKSVIITLSSFFIYVTRLANLSAFLCFKRCSNGFDHPLFSKSQGYVQLGYLHM